MYNEEFERDIHTREDVLNILYDMAHDKGRVWSETDRYALKKAIGMLMEGENNGNQ